jgi:adenylate kinase
VIRLVMLGRQGAGKGTQAERVARRYGVEHLSTGALFRRRAELGTPVGLEAKRYMDEGKLVPDEVVIAVVEESLAPGAPLADGFVLDGFPRTREQAVALDGLLGEHPLDLVIDLDVPEDIVMDRMLARGREDDTPEAIQTRLDLYARQTLPIVEHYQHVGILEVVDGVGHPDEVFERIIRAVAGRVPASR